jgi:REP element-mobilizing transposase RayT
MTGEAVILTSEQRDLVDSVIVKHCNIRKWILHARNVRTNHVHVVVSAAIDGEEIRAQLKAWCSRVLSEHAGFRVRSKDGQRRWWTEGGDIEWIADEDYLHNAVRYVDELQ